ncbi:MAG TPA: LamG domain-containing protein [Kofleriaceae bacterium]
MRVLLAALVVAGCSFDHGFEAQPDGGGSAIDPSIDAGVGSLSTCKRPDPALRLCIELTDGTGADSSGLNMIVNENDVGTTTRGNDPAGAVYWQSDLDVAEHMMLDISQKITFETHLYVAQFPPPYTFFTFVRNEGQYHMSLDSQGKLRCWIGGSSTDTTISRDAWHHIACVYDGSKLKIYVDGSVAKCSDLTGPIPIGGTTGTRVVDNLTAFFDDVRIYARDLSGADICTHADKTDCNSECD